MSRPALHLTPSRGWMNDPLGVVDHDGELHLFFQHVPDGTAWAPACAWGHATSRDLVHWTEQPVALGPAADELGAWSGCVVPDGSGRLLYTSVGAGDVERGRVREALPTDATWRTWRPGRVLAEPPPELPVVSFRDPSVFRDGDRWGMLVGARLEGGTAAALLYTSADLETWQYAGPFAERSSTEQDPVWTGTMWECPHLVRTPDGDVLVVSVCSEDGLHDVVAAVGAYDGGRFVARSWQRLTSGTPYAATVFIDRAGRPGLLTWLREVTGGPAGDPTDDRDGVGAGWAGAVSLPLRLEVVDGRVRLDLHPAVDALRRPHGSGPLDLVWRPPGRARLDVAGAAFEVDGRVLRIAADGRSATLPVGDSVRVVVDGPVVAAVSGGAFAALPLPAGAVVEPRASAGELHRWTLH